MTRGNQSDRPAPTLWQLKTGATLVYVVLSVVLVLQFFGTLHLFGRTAVSPRSSYEMTTGSCSGQTALDCAKDLVDLSLAAAIALPTAAVVAIPAMLFMKRRSELFGALVSTLSCFIGLFATLVTKDKTTQLWLILATLAFTLLVNLVGPLVDTLRRKAIAQAEKRAVESVYAESKRVDDRRAAAWREQTLARTLPIGVSVMGHRRL